MADGMCTLAEHTGTSATVSAGTGPTPMEVWSSEFFSIFAFSNVDRGLSSKTERKGNQLSRIGSERN